MKAPKYARDICVGTDPMVTEPIYWPQCKRGTQYFSGSRGEGGGGDRNEGKCQLEQYDAEKFSQS